MRQNCSSQSGLFNPRVVLACLLCVGGSSLAMLSFSVPAQPSGTNVAEVPVASTSVPQAQVGTASSVTVTEFSDFQCPYCRQAAVVVEQVRQIYGDNVKFVFKQMPLPFHQYAFKAAQAAVIAQQQGKFWEYHDRLFATRDLSVESLKKMAAEIGLKQEEFSKSLDSAATQALVEKDIEEAKQLGVRGTPTFFVNGKVIRGAATLPTLTRAIDRALGKAPTGDQPLEAVNDNSSCEDSGRTAQVTLPNLIKVVYTKQPQAAATTTAGSVTLSPSSLNFGYQLVGTTGSQMVEAVTNSGNAPLVITDISVSGRDRHDFPMSYNFSLPVTLAPGGSIMINFSFTPASPWRAGTRNARLEISENHNSQYVPLTGIGATCLGPVPACSSGCPDSDGDGLNDAWEIADGIDFDNDGVVDFRFPHADFTEVVQTGTGTGMVLVGRTNPNSAVSASSIVVTINTAGQVGAATFSYTINGGLPIGPIGTSQAVDLPGNIRLTFANGQLNPSFVAGTTFSFSSGDFKVADPNRPNVYVQYDYMDWTATPSHACTVDADCVGGGGELFDERCHEGFCNHTHNPDLIAPGFSTKVVAAYAAHGITLYIDPAHQALPHSNVVSWRTPQLACEGADVAPGVLGAYAVNFFDLKNFSSDNIAPGFGAIRKLVYHYAIFGHYSGCDFDSMGFHCNQCPAARSGQPTAGQTGMSELPGNDFIVSLGHYANDQNHPLGLFNVGGTFMHELGHNFGLQHGGDTDHPWFKPNYLSVMNYAYQLTGIMATDAPPADPAMGVLPGEINHAKTRLDYSEETVNTLDEVFDGLMHFGLNEPGGLACSGADALSVFPYTDDGGDSALGSCTGPVNWNIVDDDVSEVHVVADLNLADHPGSVFHTQLTGHTDWGPSFITGMPFQCTDWGSADGAAFREHVTASELSPEMAMRAHVLYPPRSVHIEITPGHADKRIAPGRGGEFAVALLGSANLDVREIELSSLRFHGALPLRMEFSDINRDGHLDLVVFFDQASVHLHPQATKAHVTGWLKNSQLFIGDDRITIVR